MMRKKDQSQKPTRKRSEGSKKNQTNTASQITRSHIQVRSTLPPMGTNNSSAEHHADLNARPTKRLKPTTTEGPGHVISQKTTAIVDKSDTLSAEKDFSLSKDAQILPPELHHLQTSFEFTIMSIISGSNIQKSVRKLLLTLEKFSFADLKSKPGVAILNAKASAAGKLVSIVEIAKGTIGKDRGKWYQYSKLHGEIKPLEQKTTKQGAGGRTMREWQTEQKRPREESPARSTVQEVEETKLGGDVDDEDEDAFETMGFAGLGERSTATQEHEARSKVRAVPVMTIYMSRVPVPGLKAIFGYVMPKYLDSQASITYRTPQGTDERLNSQILGSDPEISLK